MAEAERNYKEKKMKKKRLPKGISEYQVANCPRYLKSISLSLYLVICYVIQLDKLVQCILIRNIFQAAWIVDDSDADYSDSEGDDDGMVVDDGENGFPGQKLQNDFEFDDDKASLNLRDSDDESETESVMMMVGIFINW